MKRTTIPDTLFVLALFLMFVAGYKCGTMLCLGLGILSILMTALGAAMLSGPDDDEDQEPVKKD